MRQVLRHVLAHLAVAARRAAHEHAVLVHERDREPVDLRLGHEPHVAHLHALAREVALAPHHPGRQLLLVARVRERQHRLEVRHLLELVERLAAHALRGRVRASAARDAPPRCRAARSAARRSPGPRSPGRRGRSSGARGTRAGGAAPRRGSLRRSRYSTASVAGRSSRSRSKPASSSTPAWSVRSKWIGVTAIRPSAIAAKSVPVLVLVARLLAVEAVAAAAALALLGQLHLVVVDALAEPARARALHLAGGPVHVQERARRASAPRRAPPRGAPRSGRAARTRGCGPTSDTATAGRPSMMPSSAAATVPE